MVRRQHVQDTRLSHSRGGHAHHPATLFLCSSGECRRRSLPPDSDEFQGKAGLPQVEDGSTQQPEAGRRFLPAGQCGIQGLEQRVSGGKGMERLVPNGRFVHSPAACGRKKSGRGFRICRVFKRQVLCGRFSSSVPGGCEYGSPGMSRFHPSGLGCLRFHEGYRCNESP